VVNGSISGNHHLSFADAKLVGEADGDYAGRSVAVGDIDADGFADIVVGAHGESTNGSMAGAVYLVFGPATGTIDLSTADAKYLAEDDNNHVGWSVATGDTDGDGAGDLLIGAPYRSGYAGAAYLVSGPHSGTFDLGTADAYFTAEDHDDSAGSAVALGDIDGDGLDDVLIGARQGGGTATQSGAVYVVLGPASGTVDLSTYDAKYGGETYHAYLGWSLDTGDVNGDGTEDIIVGAYGAGGTPSTGVGHGAAYVLLGPHSGSQAISVADATVSGDDDWDETGYSVCAADIDGDSVDDFLVGSPGEDRGDTGAGAVSLLYGPVTGSYSISTTDAFLLGEDAQDRSGTALSSGDVDGSGVVDIVVGASETDSITGAAYLILGGGM
jgi:hypothetical protein